MDSNIFTNNEQKIEIDINDIANYSNIPIKTVARFVAYITNIKIEDLIFSNKNVLLTADQLARLNSYISKSLLGEPISKILNQRYFWKSLFFINHNVLDPRPETEFIVEYVIQKIKSEENVRFLDCGTGSGCILLSILLEFPNSHGVGIDKSCEAIAVAKQNANSLNIDNADFINIDWNVFESKNKYDYIISNPPYIPSDEIEKLEKSVKCFDPIEALDGGINGIELYCELFDLADKYLKDDGLLIFEIGIGQYSALFELAKRKQYIIYDKINDFLKIIRIIVLKKQKSIFS